MKKYMRWMGWALLGVACNANTVDGPQNTVCPEDSTEVVLPSGEVSCKIERPIVIETGFECKSVLRNHRFDFESFSVCDRRPMLPRPDFDFLNGLDLHARYPSVFPAKPTALPPAGAIDLLWVIDNSGSMCEEQGQIIANVRSFVSTILDAGIDLQMGVTTTHTNPDYELEPLARPGELQSSPQPVPGFDPQCIYALGDDGQPIPGDFSPVRAALAIAQSCLEVPASPDEFDWTDDEIACALERTPGCQIAELGCTQDECTPEMLFPAPSRYRVLPRVFKSSAYKTGTSYDFDAMSRDLACMTLVGTRGYGIERGFEAATLALSPALAGPGKVNEGLVRPDARLGVLFVADEDDCSGEVELDLCNERACRFARTDSAWGTLVSPVEVANTLVDQAAALKGRPFDPRELLVASFHAPGGNAVEVPPQTVSYDVCTTDPMYEEEPSCVTALGIAFGGERYGEFLRAVPLGNAYPFSPNRVTPIEGVVCEGGLFNPLNDVATFFVSAVKGQN